MSAQWPLMYFVWGKDPIYFSAYLCAPSGQHAPCSQSRVDGGAVYRLLRAYMGAGHHTNRQVSTIGHCADM